MNDNDDETKTEQPEIYEGSLKWQYADSLRCARIGLSATEILVVQILAGLPQGDYDKNGEWVKVPGIVWIAAERLAAVLYASPRDENEAENLMRSCARLLDSLVARGYFIEKLSPRNGKARRYDLRRLIAWMDSVDVTDVYRDAKPPIPLPADMPAPPSARPRPKRPKALQLAPKKKAPGKLYDFVVQEKLEAWAGAANAKLQNRGRIIATAIADVGTQLGRALDENDMERVLVRCKALVRNRNDGPQIDRAA